MLLDFVLALSLFYLSNRWEEHLKKKEAKYEAYQKKMKGREKKKEEVRGVR